MKDDGSGEFIYRNSGSKTVQHPFVMPTDAGIFADLLVRAPPKQDLLGVGEMASFEKFFDILGQVTGIKTTVVEVTIESQDKLIPGGLGREVAETTAASAEFGWGNLVLPKDVSSFRYEDEENFIDLVFLARSQREGYKFEGIL